MNSSTLTLSCNMVYVFPMIFFVSMAVLLHSGSDDVTSYKKLVSILVHEKYMDLAKKGLNNRHIMEKCNSYA